MGMWFAAMLVVLLSGAVLTTMVIRSRKDTAVRAGSVMVFMASAVMTGLLSISVLSHPTPTWMSERICIGSTASPRVLGFKMVEGEAIYVLLDYGGHPRYHALPWDRKIADKLTDLASDPRKRDRIRYRCAGRDRGDGRKRHGRGSDFDYDAPPANPPKTDAGPGLRFQPEE